LRLYRYWCREPAQITIAGQPRTISTYGRSNVSEDDARRDARERARRVEQKIAGEKVAKEDYAADIREETVREIDAKNVVTRNRYGALVLNSESLVIVDIDTHRKTFLESLGFGKRDNKAAIIADIEKVSADPAFGDAGFRIYETGKGIRLIVTGLYFDPADGPGIAFLQRCNADKLYAKLCIRQKCYRARLTPKPHRIKQARFTYRWPMDAQQYEEARAWVGEYDSRSEAFATCRFVKALGKQHMAGDALAFHDEATKARSQLALA
jgi:hypothetical protein